MRLRNIVAALFCMWLSTQCVGYLPNSIDRVPKATDPIASIGLIRKIFAPIERDRFTLNLKCFRFVVRLENDGVTDLASCTPYLPYRSALMALTAAPGLLFVSQNTITLAFADIKHGVIRPEEDVDIEQRGW